MEMIKEIIQLQKNGVMVYLTEAGYQQIILTLKNQSDRKENESDEMVG